jgi:hypothetical protein
VLERPGLCPGPAGPAAPDPRLLELVGGAAKQRNQSHLLASPKERKSREAPLLLILRLMGCDPDQTGVVTPRACDAWRSETPLHNCSTYFLSFANLNAMVVTEMSMVLLANWLGDMDNPVAGDAAAQSFVAGYPPRPPVDLPRFKHS